MTATKNDNYQKNTKKYKNTNCPRSVVDDHENDGKKSCLSNFLQDVSKPACKTRQNCETPVKIALLDKKLEISILLHEYFQKR